MKTFDLQGLREMYCAYWNAAVIRAAVKLEIFTLLQKKTLSATEISTQLKGNLRFVTSFLEACVELELLEKEGEAFKNTDIATQFLILGTPKYQGDSIIHFTNFWQTWGNLEKRILEGTPELPYENGFVDESNFWSYYIKNRHNLAMRGQAEVLVKHVDLKGKRKLLDLGGASGSYSITFCEANPQLNAVILDLKEALEVTKEILQSYNLNDQIHLLAADFNKDDIGEGYDVVLCSALFRILSDEEAQALLQKVYDVLLPGGLIIIQEFTPLNEDAQQSSLPPIYERLMGLFLITGFTTANNRSKKDLVQWVENTSFLNLELVALPTETTLIMAQKPDSK